MYIKLDPTSAQKGKCCYAKTLSHLAALMEGCIKLLVEMN